MFFFSFSFDVFYAVIKQCWEIKRMMRLWRRRRLCSGVGLWTFSYKDYVGWVAKSLNDRPFSCKNNCNLHTLNRFIVIGLQQMSVLKWNIMHFEMAYEVHLAKKQASFSLVICRCCFSSSTLFISFLHLKIHFEIFKRTLNFTPQIKWTTDKCRMKCNEWIFF